MSPGEERSAWSDEMVDELIIIDRMYELQSLRSTAYAAPPVSPSLRHASSAQLTKPDAMLVRVWLTVGLFVCVSE